MAATAVWDKKSRLNHRHHNSQVTGTCSNHRPSEGLCQRPKALGTKLPFSLVDIMTASRPSRGLILRKKPSLVDILQAVKLYQLLA